MKACILFFSPSGNTKKASQLISEQLSSHGISSHLVDISKNSDYFHGKNKKENLFSLLPEHDVLFIGGPVYAHHLQYHVLDLIQNLPSPSSQMGSLAIPFVTYGGIHSGVALEEAGKLLSKGNRRVLMGLKLSAPHHMANSFSDTHTSTKIDLQSWTNLIDTMIKALIQYQDGSLSLQKNTSLGYQSPKDRILARFVFQEKVWHEKRYPKLSISQKDCTLCGNCVRSCPISHLANRNGSAIEKRQETECIHCFHCISCCPQHAISPQGDLEHAKEFMRKNLAKGGEKPQHKLYSNLRSLSYFSISTPSNISIIL